MALMALYTIPARIARGNFCGRAFVCRSALLEGTFHQAQRRRKLESVHIIVDSHHMNVIFPDSIDVQVIL